MQVLVALAERPGEVVTRDELMAQRLARRLRHRRRAASCDPRAAAPLRRRCGTAGGDRNDTQARLSADRADRARRSPADPGLRRVRTSAPVVACGATAGRRPGRLAWMPRFAAIAALLVAATLAGIVMLRFGMARPASVDTEARVRFTPFTSEPGNEVDPALSASGRLAYVARGADGRAHLFTKIVAGCARRCRSPRAPIASTRRSGRRTKRRSRLSSGAMARARSASPRPTAAARAIWCRARRPKSSRCPGRPTAARSRSRPAPRRSPRRRTSRS